jgi:anti-anti-sigma factor
MEPLWFEVSERRDPDGVLRLALVGELDLAVVDTLSAELRRHQRDGRWVRLDLSQLEFIDCGGIDVLTSAMTAARPAGWKLEVDRRISRTVSRMLALAGAHGRLWPASQAASR